jgi:hypothetical protein
MRKKVGYALVEILENWEGLFNLWKVVLNIIKIRF